MARVVNVRREECDVYIGRAHAGRDASPWGNPYVIVDSREADKAIRPYAILSNRPGFWCPTGYFGRRADLVPLLFDLYRIHVERHLGDQLGELVGARLGCWCKPGPCHGDVLVKLLVARGLDVVTPEPQLALPLG